MLLESLYRKVLLGFYRNKKGISIGKGTTFRRKFYLHVGQQGKIFIGQNSFFNHNFAAYAYSSIRIGDNCIFGKNVKIYDHNHRFNVRHQLIKDQGFSIAPIEIGNDVWVGTNAVLLKGCKIGDHCVIGAGTVVSGTIPDNSIVKNGQLKVELIRYY